MRAGPGPSSAVLGAVGRSPPGGVGNERDERECCCCACARQQLLGRCAAGGPCRVWQQATTSAGAKCVCVRLDSCRRWPRGGCSAATTVHLHQEQNRTAVSRWTALCIPRACPVGLACRVCVHVAPRPLCCCCCCLCKRRFLVAAHRRRGVGAAQLCGRRHAAVRARLPALQAARRPVQGARRRVCGWPLCSGTVCPRRCARPGLKPHAGRSTCLCTCTDTAAGDGDALAGLGLGGGLRVQGLGAGLGFRARARGRACVLLAGRALRVACPDWDGAWW